MSDGIKSNKTKEKNAKIQSMELQMFGAKILAALLFIFLLQASVATTADPPVAVSTKSTTSAASPNNSTPPAVGSPWKRLRRAFKAPAAVHPTNSTASASPKNSTTTPPPPPAGSRWKRLRRAFKEHFANFTPEFNWEQQQYLKAHNDLRQEMGIPPLKWDAGLAKYAHSWAMRRRLDCKYRMHSKGQFGENSFWMQYKDYTPTEVVQKWFSEQQFFDPTRNVCKCKIEAEDCECGHYLNVIWKTTQKVGCSGYVYCEDQQGLLVYCSYFPRGNFKGQNPLNPRKALSKLSHGLSHVIG